MRRSLLVFFRSCSFTTRRSFSTAAGADLASLLHSCCSHRHIYQIHGFILTSGLHRNNLLLGRFLQSCSSLGLHRYAYSVFAQTSFSDLFLFNAIIRVFSCSAFPVDAVFFYSKLRLAGFRPDSCSFSFVSRAVVRLSSIFVGKQIHCQAVATGFDLDIDVVTSFIRVYSSCGCVSDARKLFDSLTLRWVGVAVWNAMISGYAKVGNVEDARHLFDSMPQRNVISWTALMTMYVRMDMPHEAITLFRRMQLEQVDPDEIAILAVLSACAQIGALELGQWIHNYIEKQKIRRILPLNNALIDMYAKSGNIRKALEVFENTRQKSIVTWTTMIAGFALHGLAKEAVGMFNWMEMAGVCPNEVTFIAILSACSHSGLFEMGRSYFNSMVKKYGIQPKIEHYGCMVDVLARGGYLQEAREVASKMPFEANAAIWGSLLAAAHMHRDAEVAKEALGHLTRLEPRNSGNYLLLSNTYAALGRLNESRIVRKVMRDKGVKKNSPSGSLIELNNVVYEFRAGKSSNLTDHATHVLCLINDRLKILERTENEFCILFDFHEDARSNIGKASEPSVTCRVPPPLSVEATV